MKTPVRPMGSHFDCNSYLCMNEHYVFADTTFVSTIKASLVESVDMTIRCIKIILS